MLNIRLRQYGPFGWTHLSLEGPGEEHFAEALAALAAQDPTVEVQLRREGEEWTPADEFEFAEDD